MWIGVMGTELAKLEWQDPSNWNMMVSDISPEMGLRFIFGIMLFFILSGGQRVFVGMFQYVVWKDITTDTPNTRIAEGKILE
jgi:hypothetical protein